MSIDWRALAAELAAELERCRPLAEVPDCLARVRAALAADGPAVQSREPASVVGEPSDEEIMGLMSQKMHNDLSVAVRAMAQQGGIDGTFVRGAMRIILNRHVVDLARAALARYGHQPAPPAQGELAELLEELRRTCFDVAPCDADTIKRAADLLAQRHPTPVPVSERLPGPEDCDDEGRCWQWIPDINGHYPLGHWELQHRDWVSDPDCDAPHWLPATALPLPQGEVQ